MLVNQADSNREELMEEYMRKIFTIQDEQLAESLSVQGEHGISHHRRQGPRFEPHRAR